MWFARGYEYIIDPSINHVFYANVTQEELNDRAIRWIKKLRRVGSLLRLHSLLGRALSVRPAQEIAGNVLPRRHSDRSQ